MMLKLEKDDILINELTELHKLILKKDEAAIKVPLEYFKLVRREYKKSLKDVSKIKLTSIYKERFLEHRLKSWNCKLVYSTVYRSLMICNTNSDYKTEVLMPINFSDYYKDQLELIKLPDNKFVKELKKYLFEFLEHTILEEINSRGKKLLSDDDEYDSIDNLINNHLNYHSEIKLSCINSGEELKELIDRLHKLRDSNKLYINDRLFTFDLKEPTYLFDRIIDLVVSEQLSYNDALSSISYDHFEKYSITIITGNNPFVESSRSFIKEMNKIKKMKLELDNYDILSDEFFKYDNNYNINKFNYYAKNESVRILLNKLSK